MIDLNINFKMSPLKIIFSRVVPLDLVSEESFEDIPMIPVIFSYSPGAPLQSFSVYDVPCKYEYEQVFVQIAECICLKWLNVLFSNRQFFC